MIHLIFVTKYRKKDRNNLKLHRKIAPKWGRSFLIKSVKLDPFAECDAILKILIYLALQFQSTSSLRKVTCPITLYTLFCLFQSTPSLWKVTEYIPEVTVANVISIHTFLAEGDCTGSVTSGCSPISIHTFLAEGDPSSPVSVPAPFSISIHTFLAEGDAVLPFRAARPSNFNPHLPRGR